MVNAIRGPWSLITTVKVRQTKRNPEGIRQVQLFFPTERARETWVRRMERQGRLTEAPSAIYRQRAADGPPPPPRTPAESAALAQAHAAASERDIAEAIESGDKTRLRDYGYGSVEEARARQPSPHIVDLRTAYEVHPDGDRRVYEVTINNRRHDTFQEREQAIGEARAVAEQWGGTLAPGFPGEDDSGLPIPTERVYIPIRPSTLGGGMEQGNYVSHRGPDEPEPPEGYILMPTKHSESGGVVVPNYKEQVAYWEEQAGLGNTPLRPELARLAKALNAQPGIKASGAGDYLIVHNTDESGHQRIAEVNYGEGWTSEYLRGAPGDEGYHVAMYRDAEGRPDWMGEERAYRVDVLADPSAVSDDIVGAAHDFRNPMMPPYHNGELIGDPNVRIPLSEYNERVAARERVAERREERMAERRREIVGGITPYDNEAAKDYDRVADGMERMHRYHYPDGNVPARELEEIAGYRAKADEIRARAGLEPKHRPRGPLAPTRLDSIAGASGESHLDPAEQAPEASPSDIDRARRAMATAKSQGRRGAGRRSRGKYKTKPDGSVEYVPPEIVVEGNGEGR